MLKTKKLYITRNGLTARVDKKHNGIFCFSGVIFIEDDKGEYIHYNAIWTKEGGFFSNPSIPHEYDLLNKIQ
jgi:hypothetical protein